MTTVVLAGELDFEGWRRAARRLRAQGVRPEEVGWSVDGDLFVADAPGSGADASFWVPAAFVELAGSVMLHRSGARFDLLYRLLWRLADQPSLLRLHSDPDVRAAARMRKAVDLAAHKMKAFVRFRPLRGTGPGGREAQLAWFEPAHRVLEKTAPFFVRRFASLDFSILTPDACAHWNGRELSFTPGVARPAEIGGGAIEELWLAYYAAIFNPARLRMKAMGREMPRKYWRNLPEARLIPELAAGARARTAAMVEDAPSEPRRRIRRLDARSDPPAGEAITSLQALAGGLRACRRCALQREATQPVAGEGPGRARLMLVGEQPGDLEDLAGRPFVGPAGQLLDRALAEAGIDRASVYVTNAVKHFKHEPRGKRRLHRTPDAGEVEACRWWLDHERRLVRPQVVVALGATAGGAVFGRPTPVLKSRGQPLGLPGGVRGFVTVHPSYLLRLSDPAQKARAFGFLVEDLRAAAAA